MVGSFFRTLWCVSVVALVLLMAGSVSSEMVAPDQPVPIDRLIDNLTRYAERHSDDSMARYQIARVHSLGFVQNKKTFDTWGLKDEHSPPGRRTNFWDDDPYAPPANPASYGPMTEERQKHLQAAIQGFAKVIVMERDTPQSYWSGLAWLGMAYLCEQGSVFASAIAWPAEASIEGKMDETAGILSRNEWLERALVAYKGAYTSDPQSNSYNPCLVEGGRGVLRIYGSLGKRDHIGEFTPKKIEARIKYSESLPRIVDPVVFSRRGAATLNDLLAPGVTAPFDLEGYGEVARWPWLKPDASLLVWDPENRGVINSGRQLFGSVTWWAFWRDGYQVLAALDDNGDGWLRGGELHGIAAWTDVNSNGVSDAGEVVPIWVLNISGIATQIAGHLASGEAYATEGIELGDGTMLPTYDWTPKRLK